MDPQQRAPFNSGAFRPQFLKAVVRQNSIDTKSRQIMGKKLRI
jgi:hypothetical protein